MIPDGSRVGIGAKIHAGYCQWQLQVYSLVRSRKTVTTGKVMTFEELDQVQDRNWEDVDVGYPYSVVKFGLVQVR